MNSQRPRRPERRRAPQLLIALVVVLAAAAWGGPSPGGPAVRLPDGEFASDAWDFVARFDTGHLVFSQAVVTNIGWGDRKAAVVGLVAAPDDEVQVFRRSEEESGWKLSRDGLRMDLRSIVFDRGQERHHLDVGKDEFELHVEWTPSQQPVWPASLPQRCPVEVHEIASPASGSLWSEGMSGPTPLPSGRVALTHRWTAELEASCLRRRAELFVLEAEIGVYFTEIVTSAGTTHRWVALLRDGRVVHEGTPERAVLAWRPGTGGYPTLRSVELAAPGVRLSADVAAPFFQFDLLDRVAPPFRNALATRTEPRLMLARAKFELELEGAGDAPATERTGGAVVKLDYANPLPADGASAPAAGG